MTFQLVGSGPQIYEEVMVPLWFGRWAEELVDLLSPQASESVLDVACGTGVTTRLAKKRVGTGGRVDGLDINAPMLAKAKELADGLDVNWIESDVCDSGLPPETYDVIMSQHGYHYFPDKPGALREFWRLLAPGGRMAFSIWDGHSPYTNAICAAVESHISPEIAKKQRSQRETPSADDLREQVRSAGFSDVSIRRQELMIEVPLASEFVPLHLGSMPIAGAFIALSEEAQTALVEDVANALSGYAKGARLVYPDAVHVAIGHK
ncbi:MULTISPECIES: class I SAM-dependent methyltransferase [Rhodobacterales]|jgi:ubiquinone/menaquinone biosynthesis C-methylase UbiE|uniref:Ubiquinone/menaquinone biosynthesis C-methylase UbiE n=2 Tax=Rhodobacterales TaxID=204455 RepID=A0A840CFG6_9RHOB|nr:MULTISPECIES: class I SAM-dependent methyltransferase [Rhodobacterales]MBB4024075.1 ubiquinone/menaquinone biosynthesis C-methylase UbiE [Actibacterium naphthalenivorans]TDL83761.1 methyltransferase domain-containing protein [Fluviibacterium aquatile]